MSQAVQRSEIDRQDLLPWRAGGKGWSSAGAGIVLLSSAWLFKCFKNREFRPPVMLARVFQERQHRCRMVQPHSPQSKVLMALWVPGEACVCYPLLKSRGLRLASML